MELNYKYKINKLVKENIENLHDCITAVHYTKTGVDSNNTSVDFSDVLELTDFMWGGFTPYHEVTKYQVISWIENDKNYMKSVDKSIKTLIDQEYIDEVVSEDDEE